MLQGCTECTTIVDITLINESPDTLLCSMHINTAPPTRDFEMDRVLPHGGKLIVPGFEEDIEWARWGVWLVKQSTVDQYGVQTILDRQIWDTVMYFSWGELEAMDFNIRWRHLIGQTKESN